MLKDEEKTAQMTFLRWEHALLWLAGGFWTTYGRAHILKPINA